MNTRPQRPRSMRYGFTLVELLVVIAIITILAAIALPATLYSMHSARIVACRSNQEQVALAFMHAHDTCGQFRGAGAPHTVNGQQVGEFRTDPQGRAYGLTDAKQPARCGDQHASFFFEALIYLDQENVWKEKSLEALKQSNIKVYQCPADREIANGQSSYALNAGNFGPNALVGLDPMPLLRDPTIAGPLKLNYAVANGQLVKINDGRGWGGELRDGGSNIVFTAHRAKSPCNDFPYFHGRPSSDSSGALFRNSTLFSGGEELQGAEGIVFVRPELLVELLVSCTNLPGTGEHGPVTVISKVDGSSLVVDIDIDRDVARAMFAIGDGVPLNMDQRRPEFLGGGPVGPQ